MEAFSECVSVHQCVYQVLIEVRRDHQRPWFWSHGELWVDAWVLWIEPHLLEEWLLFLTPEPSLSVIGYFQTTEAIHQVICQIPILKFYTFITKLFLREILISSYVNLTSHQSHNCSEGSLIIQLHFFFWIIYLIWVRIIQLSWLCCHGYIHL